MPEPLKIVIADFRVIIQNGLTTVMDHYDEFEVCGITKDSKELRNALLLHEPDVVIFDYAQGENIKLEDVKMIRTVSPKTGVLIITSDLANDKVHYVLEQGINGFLLTQCDEEEIYGAIKATAEGEKFFCGKVLDIILQKERERENPTCEPTNLSKRELDVVKLISKGLTTTQMADELCLSGEIGRAHV